MQYKVVRTYDDKDDTTNDLQKAFNEGWQFVRASEYVPAERHGGYTRYGYIEYILSKEDIETEDVHDDINCIPEEYRHRKEDIKLRPSTYYK